MLKCNLKAWVISFFKSLSEGILPFSTHRIWSLQSPILEVTVYMQVKLLKDEYQNNKYWKGITVTFLLMPKSTKILKGKSSWWGPTSSKRTLLLVSSQFLCKTWKTKRTNYLHFFKFIFANFQLILPHSQSYSIIWISCHDISFMGKGFNLLVQAKYFSPLLVDVRIIVSLPQQMCLPLELNLLHIRKEKGEDSLCNINIIWSIMNARPWEHIHQIFLLLI